MAKPFQCETGTYTGTGAALTVTVGFKPKLFIAYNVTDGDTIVGITDSMTADTGFSIAAAVGAISSNGFTLNTDGTIDIGTNALANESAKVYHYLALGGN